MARTRGEGKRGRGGIEAGGGGGQSGGWLRMTGCVSSSPLFRSRLVCLMLTCDSTIIFIFFSYLSPSPSLVRPVRASAIHSQASSSSSALDSQNGVIVASHLRPRPSNQRLLRILAHIHILHVHPNSILESMCVCDLRFVLLVKGKCGV